MIDCRIFFLSIHPIANFDASSDCSKVLKPHTDGYRSAIPSAESADGRLLLTCSDDHVEFSVPLSKCTPLYSFLQTANITDIESAAFNQRSESALVTSKIATFNSNKIC